MKVVKAPFPILCNIWLSTITVYLFKVLARKHARKKLPFLLIYFSLISVYFCVAILNTMVFRTRAEQFPAFKITYTSLECGLDISLCFFIKLFGFLFRFHVVLLQRMLFNYHVI